MVWEDQLSAIFILLQLLKFVASNADSMFEARERQFSRFDQRSCPLKHCSHIFQTHRFQLEIFIEICRICLSSMTSCTFQCIGSFPLGILVRSRTYPSSTHLVMFITQWRIECICRIKTYFPCLWLSLHPNSRDPPSLCNHEHRDRRPNSLCPPARSLLKADAPKTYFPYLLHGTHPNAIFPLKTCSWPNRYRCYPRHPTSTPK